MQMTACTSSLYLTLHSCAGQQSSLSSLLLEACSFGPPLSSTTIPAASARCMILLMHPTKLQSKDYCSAPVAMLAAHTPCIGVAGHLLLWPFLASLAAIPGAQCPMHTLPDAPRYSHSQGRSAVGCTNCRCSCCRPGLQSSCPPHTHTHTSTAQQVKNADIHEAEASADICTDYNARLCQVKHHRSSNACASCDAVCRHDTIQHASLCNL